MISNRAEWQTCVPSREFRRKLQTGPIRGNPRFRCFSYHSEHPLRYFYLQIRTAISFDFRNSSVLPTTRSVYKKSGEFAHLKYSSFPTYLFAASPNSAGKQTWLLFVSHPLNDTHDWLLSNRISRVKLNWLKFQKQCRYLDWKCLNLRLCSWDWNCEKKISIRSKSSEFMRTWVSQIDCLPSCSLLSTKPPWL